MVVLNLANGPGASRTGCAFPRWNGSAPPESRCAGTSTRTTGSARGRRPRRPAPSPRLVPGRRRFPRPRRDRRRASEPLRGPDGLGRDAGARLVVFNHGAHPVEAYADHADLLGTFEGSWSSYVELGVPRWVRSRPAGQFFHLLHSVPRRPWRTRGGWPPAGTPAAPTLPTATGTTRGTAFPPTTSRGFSYPPDRGHPRKCGHDSLIVTDPTELSGIMAACACCTVHRRRAPG